MGTSITVPIAMIGWLAVVPVLFALMPARRAVLTGLLLGWLFLPNAGYGFESLPDYTKLSATTMVVLVCAMAFDFRSFAQVRPAWYDLPITVWCLCPFASSITSGLGAWDGFSQVLNQIIGWGAPYLLGRAYFRDLVSIRELATALCIGALVYLPLVAFEIRMSPQLHTWVYGFHQHDIRQARRGDLWRPTVFLQHGLAVSMFMGAAGVVAFWLWRCRAVTALRSLPMSWAAAGIVGITILSNSFGAIVLTLGGIGGLWLLRARRSRWVIIAIIAFPVLYMTSRALLGWQAHELVDIAAEFSQDRAGSLRSRLGSENGSINRMGGLAMIFGEGRFIFAGMAVEEGGSTIIPDGYWLIALVRSGAVGLISMSATLLLPCWMCVRRLPPQAWCDPRAAPIVSLGVVVALWMTDNIFNAMLNPIFPLAAGAVQGAVAAVCQASRAQAPVHERVWDVRSIAPRAGTVRS